MLSYMSDLELFSKIKSLVHTYSYDLNHVLEKDGLYNLTTFSVTLVVYFVFCAPSRYANILNRTNFLT